MKKALFGTRPASVLLATIALVVSLMFISIPAFASAATYAYVDVSGEVRPVTADTWQSAIAAASQIHPHSGVLRMMNDSDLSIMGNTMRISGY